MSDRAMLHWRCALIAALAALYVAVALSSSGIVVTVGLVGAVTILGALALAITSGPQPAALVLVATGALPLALVSWTSVVTPLVAVLCLGLAWPLSGHVRRPRRGATGRPPAGPRRRS